MIEARGAALAEATLRGGGRLKDHVDLSLVLPTAVTARAQEMHLAVGHVVCELVERSFLERT